MNKTLLLLSVLGVVSVVIGKRMDGSQVCGGAGWSNLNSCTCTCKDSSTFSRNRDSWKDKKAKWMPCKDKVNVDTCTCKDGKTVGNDFKKDCGGWKNFPTTCQCKDGTTWDKSSVQYEKPCNGKGWKEISGCSCDCLNGESWSWSKPTTG